MLGCDAAGIIDSVGELVKDFKTGDEVFSFCGMNNRAGAFQEIITVSSHFVAKKPALLTFEEAASLTVCYLTAAAAINIGLHVTLPYLDPKGNSPLKSILVLGGSSGVGAGAIQLLRQALPSAIILTTSSAQHHAHLLSLGATKCFERSAQDDTSAIKAATPEGAGVDAILDSVQAAASQSSVFTALDPNGPKIYSQVMTGVNLEVPEGVSSTVIYCREIFSVKSGMNAMPVLATLERAGNTNCLPRSKLSERGLMALTRGWTG